MDYKLDISTLSDQEKQHWAIAVAYELSKKFTASREKIISEMQVAAQDLVRAELRNVPSPLQIANPAHIVKQPKISGTTCGEVEDMLVKSGVFFVTGLDWKHLEQFTDRTLRFIPAHKPNITKEDLHSLK